MAEILDVINRFTYQVEDAELQQATQQIQSQVQSIAVMAQRMQNLQNAFDRTSNSEIEKRTRIAGLIQRQKQSIDQTTQAIGKQVRENEKLQNAITKEIGLINTLDARLKVLREDRARAFDPKDIQRFNREIEVTQKRIATLTTTSKGGFLGGIGSSILQGVGIGTGIGLVTQGVGAIKNFIEESSQLAAEAEGVGAAFERLNKPDLLDNLRDATKGTVSDLELMKNAINFNNFGLPLDKLGVALEFARRRAKDTGQEVDFLVQSIVTGIGRQSPLILDNLGINAKRVADRFKETGDFALAAFQIIQEESAKAGEDLDTFAEQTAQFNARLENAQVRLGNVFNNIFKGLLSEALKIKDAFAKDLEDIGIIQKEYEAEQVRNLDSFFTEYESADKLGKNAIESAARQHYNELIRQQQKFLTSGFDGLADGLQGQLDLYRDFFNKIAVLQNAKPAVSFENFTSSDLRGLNKDELQKLRESGTELLGISIDDAEIARLKGRIRQIDTALERYSLTIKKIKKEKPVKIKDLIAQTPEEWARDIDKVVSRLDKLRKAFGIQPVETGVVGNKPTGEFNSDIILADANRIKFEEEQRKKADEKAKEARELKVQQEKDAFNTIANAAIQAYGTILQAQINAADAEIAIRQSRVNAAIELAEKGNTELLEIEQKRLEESIKEREKYAQRQAVINAAMTVSQSVLAIATAAGESGAGAIVIVPAVIAAIAAGFAAVTALSTETTAGFKDGVIDLDGEGNGRSDSIPARLSKGESVITAEATRKNRAVLQAINDGAVFSMPNTHTVNNTSYGSPLDMGGVVKGLQRVERAVADNKFKQDIFFNEYGVGTLTEKAMKAAQRQWS